MKYQIVGRSRFTGTHLQLQMEAPSAEDALERAVRLGLVEPEVHAIALSDSSAAAQTTAQRRLRTG